MSSIPFKPTRPLPSTSNSILEITFPPDCQSSISIITFNAPSKLNAFTRQDIQVLIDLLNWVSEQPQLTITIFTAKGRFFSAGADIKDTSRNPPKEALELKEDDPKKRSMFEQHYKSRLATSNNALVEALINHKPLLVGALNGPSVGILAAMLGHFDLIYSYSNFWISTPFSSLGLVAEGLASMTFVRKVSETEVGFLKESAAIISVLNLSHLQKSSFLFSHLLFSWV